jgi:hypothetical protein
MAHKAIMAHVFLRHTTAAALGNIESLVVDFPLSTITTVRSMRQDAQLIS